MSKQFYDVRVFFKKDIAVRVYAENKKEAKILAKGCAPEKCSDTKKHFEILGDEGYIEGSWQVSNDIIAKGQNIKDVSGYDEIIETIEGQIIHTQKHPKE